KVRQFARSSHMILEANEAYPLGRPRLDEILVRFIPEQNTMIANVLAGEVDMTLSRGLSVEQAIVVRDQWKDGKIAIKMESWTVILPQYVNPDPAVVADVRFRRALLHAMNRQEIVETIQMGMVPVAHNPFQPTDVIYRDVESSIVRYEYDPRMAAQLIGGLGY